MVSQLLTPYEYQAAEAPLIAAALQAYHMYYMAWEERTGKSLTAVLAIEMLADYDDVLVLTTKKALPDWLKLFDSYPVKKNWRATNYHQLKKERKPDIVVLDEAHNYISAYPKPGLIWKQLKPRLRGLPILYLSATPHAQGYSMLYHQFALSSWSPWRQYQTFYDWHRHYGIPETVMVHDREVAKYNKTDEELVLASIEHLFSYKTRAELGFEHEPEDVVHYIDLALDTRYVYNQLMKHKLYDLRVGKLVCDTIGKLRAALHMLEGGTCKINDKAFVLTNEEKIEYILKTWGDSEDLVIMYHFQAEQIKLQEHFKKATILQATTYAEGVDLSMYKHLVVYSMDYRSSKYSQRRARQANKQRKEPINVHFLLVKNAISDQVYETVCLNKKNYVDSMFKGVAI